MEIEYLVVEPLIIKKKKYMVEGIFGVIISLVILAVVYWVLKWIIGMTEIEFPTKIVNLVFGAVGLIIVLRYLMGILH